LLPALVLLAGAGQYPLAERDDQAGFLGHRYELDGRDAPQFGMRPAQQGLGADDAPDGQVDLGLVEDEQFVVRQRRTQFGLDAHACQGPMRHVGGVELVTAAAARLGPVHRGIGIADQFFAVVGIEGIDADADAGPDRQLLALDLVRFGQRPDDFLRHMDRHVGALDRGNHEHEFIAAEAGHGVFFADQRLQARGDAAQEQVADPVVERIVDHLEAVEIEKQQRHAASVPLRASECVRQAVVETVAVRQAGQRIMLGPERDPVLGRLALAAVGTHRHPDVEATGLHDVGRHAGVGKQQHVGIGHVPAERRSVGDDIAAVFFERDEDAALPHFDAVDQQLQRKHRFAAAGAAQDDGGPPGRHATAGNLVEAADASRGFFQIDDA
jgi:hypothetical protein